MKRIIKESFKQLVGDRYLFGLIIIMVILAVAYSVIIGISFGPSELQLVNRYTSFGVTHLYRDQWFYLISFILFQLMVSGLSSVIGTKMLSIKGHSLAVMYIWLSIIIMSVGFLMSLAIINVWKPI